VAGAGERVVLGEMGLRIILNRSGGRGAGSCFSPEGTPGLSLFTDWSNLGETHLCSAMLLTGT